MLHDGVGGLDHRSALRPGDALLAITFAPYSEETLALAPRPRDARPAGRRADRPGRPARWRGCADTDPDRDRGRFRRLPVACRPPLRWPWRWPSPSARPGAKT